MIRSENGVRQMREEQFRQIESYMRSCLRDSAHDREHIYRVLYTALAIAQDETTADGDVLITSCLLHDIGRPEQFANPVLCHAVVGAKKAHDFLIGSGYPPAFAGRVSDCIRTHRFRSSDPPASIEAKILFDADKIDATGALGIARTLLYKGLVGEPLYSVSGTGAVLDGSGAEGPSFFSGIQIQAGGSLFQILHTAGQGDCAVPPSGGGRFLPEHAGGDCAAVPVRALQPLRQAEMIPALFNTTPIGPGTDRPGLF